MRSIQPQPEELRAVRRSDAHLVLIIGGDDWQRRVGPRSGLRWRAGFLKTKTSRRRGPGQDQFIARQLEFQRFQGRRSRHQHRQRSDQRLAGHVERFVLRPAPAKIRRAQEQDAADQMPVRGEDVHPIPRARPDAPVRIALDAIGNTVVDVGKDRPARERVAGRDRININAMSARGVVGIGDVKLGFIRRKTKTVRTGIAAGATKVIRHDGAARGIRVGGMKLKDPITGRITGPRFGDAAVVTRISEPDRPVRFHRHIVRRIKLPAIVIGDQSEGDAAGRHGHRIGEHGNPLPATARLRADQPFLRIEQTTVEQRVRGRQQIIRDRVWRNELAEAIVILIAEHQELAGRNPDRPFQPGIDRGIGGQDRVGINDPAELDRVGDFKRHRAPRVNPEKSPLEKSGCDSHSGVNEHDRRIINPHGS